MHTKCIQLAITRTQPNPTLNSRGIPLDVLLSQFAILDFMMFACEADFSALPAVIVVFALVTFAIRVQSAICLNDKIRKWKWKWRQPPDAISHARNLSFAIQGPDFRNRKSLISNWTWPVSGRMHSSYNLAQTFVCCFLTRNKPHLCWHFFVDRNMQADTCKYLFDYLF